MIKGRDGFRDALQMYINMNERYHGAPCYDSIRLVLLNLLTMYDKMEHDKEKQQDEKG